MFGYVRPLKAELKVREYEQFRTLYCGLCRTLKRRCGPFTDLVLNYDFVFLAMLLESGDVQECTECRCISNPFRKRSVCKTDAALELAADQSLILSWLKLRDNVKDGHFVKRLAARLGCALMYRPYRRACKRLPEYSSAALELLRELDALESAGCSDIDLAADKFARLTALSAASAEDTLRRRVLEQLLYHTGRWIYIIDAVCDLKEDAEEGSYNAVFARYGELDAEELVSLTVTLENSLSLIAAAYELLPRGTWSGVLDNIVYCGLTAVLDEALNSAREYKALERKI